MKKGIYYVWIAVMGFLIASCIDNKVYEAKLPQDPAISNPKPYALPLDSNKTFIHPGCMVSQEDFDRAKQHIAAGDEPWTTAFTALKNSPSLKRNLDNTVLGLRLKENDAGGYLVRGSADKSYYIEELDIYKRWAGNFDFEYQAMSAAYARAVYWKLTGDTRYADETVTILNSWVKNCKGVTGDNNKYLCFMEAGYDFASVAELMRDYTGWKTEDQQAFKTWLQKVFVQTMTDFLKTHKTDASGSGSTHYWSNWDLGQMLALSCIGIYCDRADLYNMVMNYVTYGGGNGNWQKFINYIHPAVAGEDDIDLGQTQEAGRDQGHNLLSIRLGGSLCRVAWNQKDDLYGYDDNRFLKAAEFVAKYNYGPLIEEQQHMTKHLTYPFHAMFVNSDGNYHTDNSTDGRGQFSSGFVSVYEHYKKYSKLNTRYVRWAAKTPMLNDSTRNLKADLTKQVLIEPDTYNHNQGAGSSFGTLLFTEDESILKK